MLSNHFHGVLRSRPDIVSTWSDEEVVWRWRLAWPTYRNGVWGRQVTDDQVLSLLQRARTDEKYLPRVRKSLGSISWFCGRLKESISRLCNAEAESSGHCWDARFGNRLLEHDDESVGATLYTDLQQMVAGIVNRVEDSLHSSIRRRLRAEAAASFLKMHDRDADPGREGDAQELEQITTLFGDCFLTPMSNSEFPLLTNPDTGVPPPRELIYPAMDAPPVVLRGFVVNNARQAELATPVTDHQDEDTGATSNPSPKQRRRGRPRRPDATYATHRRLQRTRRRRASRTSFLGILDTQYYELLMKCAERILAERGMRADGTSITQPMSATASPGGVTASGPRGATTPPQSTSDTAAPPDHATFSWHRRLRDFNRWLRGIATTLSPHLARLLEPSPRGDPPPPRSD